MHVALTPKLCAKQRNGDPLRWNDRLIAFNELFWHGAVRGALSQIKVIWHDPSELSAPVHLEHASVCLRGVWYLCWCLYFWSEEVGLTHLMERNVQRRQRHTRCFQLLSFDSDIQGWVMVLRKDHLPKNEWQEKSCFKEKTHLSETLDLPHVSTAYQELHSGVHLSVSDRSLCGWKPLMFSVVRLG